MFVILTLCSGLPKIPFMWKCGMFFCERKAAKNWIGLLSSFFCSPSPPLQKRDSELEIQNLELMSLVFVFFKGLSIFSEGYPRIPVPLTPKKMDCTNSKIHTWVLPEAACAQGCASKVQLCAYVTGSTGKLSSWIRRKKKGGGGSREQVSLYIKKPSQFSE